MDIKCSFAKKNYEINMIEYSDIPYQDFVKFSLCVSLVSAVFA